MPRPGSRATSDKSLEDEYGVSRRDGEHRAPDRGGPRPRRCLPAGRADGKVVGGTGKLEKAGGTVHHAGKVTSAGGTYSLTLDMSS
jgi:hypothetical protein